jgi:hypothetical protein
MVLILSAVRAYLGVTMASLVFMMLHGFAMMLSVHMRAQGVRQVVTSCILLMFMRWLWRKATAKKVRLAAENTGQAGIHSSLTDKDNRT